MNRRLLAAGSGASGGGGGPIPTDPTLTEDRYVTRPYAMNVNAHNIVHTGGDSFQYTNPITIMEDSADLRLVCGGRADPTSYKFAIRKGDAGTWTPVLFGGVDGVSFTNDSVKKTSDALAGPFLEGDTIHLRAYAPAGAFVPEGGSTASATVIAGSDQRLASSWTATEPFPVKGPFPVAFLGRSRSNVISPAVFGDSIAYDANWWRDACAANGRPGANFGVPVLRFSARGITGAAAGATHMLIQFGVNDINAGSSSATLWADALANYAYVQGLKPGLPLYQSTPTPIVSTTDGTATLGNQTVTSNETNRQAWNAFLRDGAPCHPTTKAQLAVGATGTVIRAGQTGHPLKGIVDIAAAVEQGGSSAPTGKWRVDLGPLASDGVHPDAAGNTAMVPPVSAWMASLT